MITNILWAEKYRPKVLDDLALGEENRKLFQAFLDAGEFPHLLLHGPAGCGKTTVARILTEHIPCKVLSLNASNERGIDTVRDKVGQFARTMFGEMRNIVFFDEGDRLTNEAQTALRNMMETYSQRTRFIITANYLYRIIDPIQSRCTMVEMGEVPFKERVRILKTILQREGIEGTSPAVLLEYAEVYTDLRRMVTAAQSSYLANGALLAPSSQPYGGTQVWEKVSTKDWKGLIQFSRQPQFDHLAALRGLFWAIPEGHPKATTMRVAAAKAVHEAAWTPDVVVHFLGTCAELMAALES